MIGNELQTKSGSVVNMPDEAFSYVTRTRSKSLGLPRAGANPMQELKVVIG